MNIRCKTVYNLKTFAAMSLVMRKTLRRRFSRLVSAYVWVILGLTLLSILVSLDDPWMVAWESCVFLTLLAIQIKQDAFNAFFSRRRLLPGSEESCTAFYPDGYEVWITGAATQWRYDKILVLAETREYIVLVLGKHHAQACPKAGVEGASLDIFRSFLEQKTGKTIQKIGRWTSS